MTLPILPQVLYTNGEVVNLEQDTIDFGERTGGHGVNLKDAYDGDIAALPNREEPAFDIDRTGVTAKITLRIQVNGYDPYARQVPAIRANKTADSISFGKLAHIIAKEMQKYMELAGPFQHGEQILTLDNLYLSKLYHVSRGSWQPEFKIYVV